VRLQRIHMRCSILPAMTRRHRSARSATFGADCWALESIIACGVRREASARVLISGIFSMSSHVMSQGA
jgi:hypothetical protein